MRFWEDQEGSCPLCERPILDPLDKVDCTIDHKIPVSHGGTDARSNLQLTHDVCNLIKGCGCPDGDHFASYEGKVQAAWRQQRSRCAICREPMTRLEILDKDQVTLVSNRALHVRCQGV